MSSFPLRRLPLVARSEVIKSMDILEIFLFSLATSKSPNFVMLPIPKNSLFAEFLFKKDGLIFELRSAAFFRSSSNIPSCFRVREKQPLMKVCFGIGYVECDFFSSSGTSKVEDSMRKLFYRFSKTLKNSKIYLVFEDGTREEFAMEILRFTWENGLPLDRISFELKDASSESIQELLDRCHEHYTSLHIGTIIPMGFKCTPPPGGYRFESLNIRDAHWINLDDFLQCQRVGIELPYLTPDYLNGLLKKIVNLESRIERFELKLKSIKPSDFSEIVRGLSESAIEQNGVRQELQFERKDGLKLGISLSNGHLSLG